MAQVSADIRQEVVPEPAGDNEFAGMRAEIVATRAGLTEKLTALRERVRGTVAAAQRSVTRTVQAVEGAFRDTRHAVHDAFDLTSHVKRRPWLMVGTAMFVGYALDCLLRPRSHGRAGVPATANGADGASRSPLLREPGSSAPGPAGVRQPTYPAAIAERQSTLGSPCRSVNRKPPMNSGIACMSSSDDELTGNPAVLGGPVDYGERTKSYLGEPTAAKMVRKC